MASWLVEVTSLKGVVKGRVDVPVWVSVLGVYLQEPMDHGVVVRLEARGGVPLPLLLLVGRGGCLSWG